MKKKIIIAIDGFSSTGKSTIAKRLANYLGYIYVDTGAMYRAVSLFALQNNFISTDHFNKKKLIESLSNINLQFKYNPDLEFSEIYLNGQNIENDIRTLIISNCVSKVAELSQVRTKLVEQQKEMGKKKGIVMDGRDIGTVVFPDAELKLFMTATPQIRAQRRYDEFIAKGQVVVYDDVYKNVLERDYIDTHRKDSPLKKAKDAIEIDNSNLDKEEQLDLILGFVGKIFYENDL